MTSLLTAALPEGTEVLVFEERTGDSQWATVDDSGVLRNDNGQAYSAGAYYHHVNKLVNGYYGDDFLTVASHGHVRAADTSRGVTTELRYECAECGLLSNNVSVFDQTKCEREQ